MHQKSESSKTIYRLGTAERRFAELIWREEPISSGKLAELTEAELGWKKSTTYTVLHRLIGKKLFQNKNSVVSSLVSKEHYQQVESRAYVEDAFQGSLPAFFNAFAMAGSISEQETEDLMEMIQEYRKIMKKRGKDG